MTGCSDDDPRLVSLLLVGTHLLVRMRSAQPAWFVITLGSPHKAYNAMDVLVMLDNCRSKLRRTNPCASQTRCLPQTSPAIDIGRWPKWTVAQDRCHSKYGRYVDPCSATCYACLWIPLCNWPCCLRLRVKPILGPSWQAHHQSIRRVALNPQRECC